MTMAAARHIRRAQGQRLLDQLASDYLDRPEVDRAPMFGSLGLRVNGKFFAFVGAEGQLVTKLPEAQAAALVAKGQATPVRAGRHLTREWIHVPTPAAAEEYGLWPELLADAHRLCKQPAASTRRTPEPEQTTRPRIQPTRCPEGDR